MKCKLCSIPIPTDRTDMGYTICTNCSTEEKKVGHIIYPHKTGAYIQVMDKDTHDNINRLDRRGVGGVKTAKHYKSIIKKKSKDLDKTAKVVRNRISSLDNIKLIPYDELLKMVMDYYDEWGYEPTIRYLKELNSKGDIALKQRAEIQDLVVERYLKPSSRALNRKFNIRGLRP